MDKHLKWRLFENALPLCKSMGAWEDPGAPVEIQRAPLTLPGAPLLNTVIQSTIQLPFIQLKKRTFFSLFSPLSARPQLSSVKQNSNFPSKKNPLPPIVHPGGGRILLSIVLNHWTGRKQQSNHITVSLGKKGQPSTGNVLRLIPARPRLFFFRTESTFHSGFWRHAGL